MNNNDSELKNSYNFLELKASNLQPDISSLIQHENDKRIRKLACTFVDSLYNEYLSILIQKSTKNNRILHDVETQISQRNKDYCIIISDNSFFSFLNNNTQQKLVSLETSDLLELSFIGKINNQRDEKLEITQTFYLEYEKNLSKKESQFEISGSSSFTIFSNKNFNFEIAENYSLLFDCKRKIYLEIAKLPSVFILSDNHKKPQFHEYQNSHFSYIHEKKSNDYSINSQCINIESINTKDDYLSRRMKEFSCHSTIFNYEIDTLLFRLNYINNHFLRNNLITSNHEITFPKSKKTYEYTITNIDKYEILSTKNKTITHQLDNSSFSLGNNKCSIEIMKKTIENKKISLNEIKSLNFKNYRIVTRNSQSYKKDNIREDESLNKAKEVSENNSIKNVSSSFYNSDFRSSFDASFDININGSISKQNTPGTLKIIPSEIKTNDDLIKKIINKLEIYLNNYQDSDNTSNAYEIIKKTLTEIKSILIPNKVLRDKIFNKLSNGDQNRLNFLQNTFKLIMDESFKEKKIEAIQNQDKSKIPQDNSKITYKIPRSNMHFFNDIPFRAHDRKLNDSFSNPSKIISKTPIIKNDSKKSTNSFNSPLNPDSKKQSNAELPPLIK